MNYTYQAVDSVTGAVYSWTSATKDTTGTGYPGPNSPLHILQTNDQRTVEVVNATAAANSVAAIVSGNFSGALTVTTTAIAPSARFSSALYTVAAGVTGKLQLLNTSAITGITIDVRVELAAGAIVYITNAAGTVLAHEYSAFAVTKTYRCVYTGSVWKTEDPGLTALQAEEAKAAAIPVSGALLVMPMTATKRNLGGSSTGVVVDYAGTTKSNATGTSFVDAFSYINTGVTPTTFTAGWRGTLTEASNYIVSLFGSSATALTATLTTGAAVTRGATFFELAALGVASDASKAVANSSEHTFIVRMLSASSAELWIDGTLVYTSTRTFTLGEQIRFGGRNSTGFADGSFRNFFAFSSALSDSDLRKLESWASDDDARGALFTARRAIDKAKADAFPIAGALAVLPLVHTMVNFGAAGGELAVTGGSPSYTASGLSFDGVDDVATIALNASATTAYYGIVRCRIPSTTGANPWAMKFGSNGIGRYSVGGDLWRLNTVGTGGVSSTLSGDAYEHTIELVQTSVTDHKVYVDGTLVISNTVDSTAYETALVLWLGAAVAGAWQAGTFRNVAIVSGTVTDAQRRACRAWAEDKAAETVLAPTATPPEQGACVSIASAGNANLISYLPKNLAPSARYNITLKVYVDAGVSGSAVSANLMKRYTFQIVTDAAGAISSIAALTTSTTTGFDHINSVTVRSLTFTLSTSTGVTVNFAQTNSSSLALDCVATVVEERRHRIS